MRTELIKKFYGQNETILKEMGIEWHEAIKGDLDCYTCSCGYQIDIYNSGAWECFEDHIENSNPTFSHPEEVLAVCMKWDDYDDFYDVICIHENGKDFINLIYITTPNKLLEAAVEWGEWREK